MRRDDAWHIGLAHAVSLPLFSCYTDFSNLFHFQFTLHRVSHVQRTPPRLEPFVALVAGETTSHADTLSKWPANAEFHCDNVNIAFLYISQNTQSLL